MLGYRKLGVYLGAVAVFALLPSAANAQVLQYSPIYWSFDVRGGVTVPVGDLDDVMDSGATIGAGLAYFLNPRLALRLDGNVDFLQAGSATNPGAPDMNIYRIMGGLELHLVDPSSSDVSLSVNLLAGAATLDSDEFSFDRPDGTKILAAQLNETYFTFDGGVRLGVNASQWVNIFVGGDVNVIFGDSDDSAFMAEFFGVDPFDTIVTIPIQGGIRINFP
ncbi:MAG: hypothetical protein ACE5HQ_01805 [Gemmatimonadota bacterium]